MFDLTESLLPSPPHGRALRAVSLGFDKTSLEETGRLLQTLGVETAFEECIVLRKVTPATYIGKGKLDEIKAQIEAHEADSVIIDADLSPKQLQNLDKALGKPCLDRSGVILEIFSRHARSKEAKTQVELAKVQYLLPRLAHLWTHFERQRGGVGQKGMGEKQIEVDRRLLKGRIAQLKKRLTEIQRERGVLREGRKDLLKVALVGYTNAGKSTLLNALTHSHVLAVDKLFATLDSSARALDPDCHPPIVAIDTVGFISRIPPSLIASFRSTLEELEYADLLLHVVDASSEHAREQHQTTESILKELGLQDKPRMVVLNKMDLIKSAAARSEARVISPGAIRVSAMNAEDVKRLRDLVLEHFRAALEVWDVMIPYDQSRLDAQIHAHGVVEKQKYLEKGVFYRLRISGVMAGKLKLDKYRT